MRYITALDSHTLTQLKTLMKTDRVHQVRQRAHAILLSAKRYKINQLSDIFDVDRDTVTHWLNRWDQDGLAGMENKPRSGRPRMIAPADEAEVLHQVQQQPRQLKTVLAQLSHKFSASLDTLKRFLKRHGYRWRRVRHSLKTQRDEMAFRQAQAELEVLKKQEDQGLTDLVYFDEAGFSLQPVVPYAWQAPSQHLSLPSLTHRRRLNSGSRFRVLGFLQRDNTFDAYVVQGRVDSDTVIACIEDFAKGLARSTTMVIDRASIHTSKVFQAAVSRWKALGLRLFFLPSYSPELNLIEHLWKAIKYRRLCFDAYAGWQELNEGLDEVLIGIGKKYRISFA